MPFVRRNTNQISHTGLVRSGISPVDVVGTRRLFLTLPGWPIGSIQVNSGLASVGAGHRRGAPLLGNRPICYQPCPPCALSRPWSYGQFSSERIYYYILPLSFDIYSHYGAIVSWLAIGLFYNRVEHERNKETLVGMGL